MTFPLSRRSFLKTTSAAGVIASAATADTAQAVGAGGGWIVGKMTGAQALVHALHLEGARCVFGIPGAQQNELWDVFKQLGMDYLLVTHEFSASTMADGYARSTGQPGVMCVVPGPGLTNSLTGISEALLDTVPMVCIVGDVAQGDNYRPFQVHEIPQAGLLKQVTKQTYEAHQVSDVPLLVRQAFVTARSGEPGPVGVVVPYDLLMESAKFECPPLAAPPLPFDVAAVEQAIAVLSNPKNKIGVYAGLGCMDVSPALIEVAEMLQAPVATSVSGRGVIPDAHPLAVGYGYGTQGTHTAEAIFKKDVDVVLAVGVRFSEVSTAFYAVPKKPPIIHVDINEHNLGAAVDVKMCVHADAGLFLGTLLEKRDCLARRCDQKLVNRIARLKATDEKRQAKNYARCGADPQLFLKALRCAADPDSMLFMDVTMAEHWANESYDVYSPRTYFNPTNNQAMGWSVPAALGAQKVHPGRQTIVVTGDGCFLMSAMEISTAAREGLPVKIFVLDNQAYEYMQRLQEPAYLRTTATILAALDYHAFAQAMGVEYNEILANHDLEGAINAALTSPCPVLTRVVVDYDDRPCRWIDTVRGRFIEELSNQQKVRFLARIGARAVSPKAKSLND